MGNSKNKRQTAAQNTSASAAAEERSRAGELRTELDRRRDIVGAGLPETMKSARTHAEDIANTGGFDSSTLEPIRAGYSDLATTGGFSPDQKEQFLRRSTAPVNAVYSRANDELERRKVIQGGYMPGYDASVNRIQRQKAIAGSEASLNANVDLNNQIRSGKTAGLAGQERIAEAEQQGKIHGQEMLQRYSEAGVSALNENDLMQLRNRLQSGQMSQYDAQLLTQLAAQDKTTFEKIMQGISVVGGATAGILAGV